MEQKREHGPGEGLLEKLHKASGCTYLSDLRISNPRFCGLNRRDIGKLEHENYSLEEWTEAVNYILECDRQFQSVKEAADFLKEEGQL